MNVLNLVKDKIEVKFNVYFNLLQNPDVPSLVDGDGEKMHMIRVIQVKKLQNGIYWEKTTKFACSII